MDITDGAVAARAKLSETSARRRMHTSARTTRCADQQWQKSPPAAYLVAHNARLTVQASPLHGQRCAWRARAVRSSRARPWLRGTWSSHGRYQRACRRRRSPLARVKSPPVLPKPALRSLNDQRDELKTTRSRRRPRRKRPPRCPQSRSQRWPWWRTCLRASRRQYISVREHAGGTRASQGSHETGAWSQQPASRAGKESTPRRETTRIICPHHSTSCPRTS